MNPFNKCLAAALVFALVLSVFGGCGRQEAPAETQAAAQTAAAAEAVAETDVPQAPEEEKHYHVGDKIDDFTVTTYDGRELSLYRILEEKDMVLLNLWGTYCDPCAEEFPAMEEAYQQYQDRVEIIALSIDPEDTDEILADYVREMGMTFPVTRDTVGLHDSLHVIGVPVSLVVDRFGTICVITEGGCDDFFNVFEIYTREDYTESVYMPSIRSKLPRAESADPDALNAALNGEGGNLVFADEPNPFYWPMVVEQVDGRTVASASNAEVRWSDGAVATQVDVNAGDVLVMEYKLFSENHNGVVCVAVDGVDVKITSLTTDWSTYAYRFEEGGSHRVTVRLERASYCDRDEVGFWIDSIRVVSGGEAEDALAKNPVYPVADAVTVDILNENVAYFRFVVEERNTVPNQGLVCLDPVVRVLITLPEDMEPETACLMDDIFNAISVARYATEAGYLVELPVDGSAPADISQLVLYCGEDYLGEMAVFGSWEAVEACKAEREAEFETDLKLEVLEHLRIVSEPEGDGIYTVTYADQNGDPVSGVMCQVCDESSCQVFVSDASGVCRFELPGGEYEIHTLKVPEGYEGDTTTVTQAPAGGGELNFVLTKK